MSKTVICYKTHILNKVIIDFIKKIYKECDESNKQMLNNFKGEFDIDFFLLIPDYLEKEIPDKLKPITIIYKEDEIKNMYTNFYSMWLSNHFIELYFYKNFGEKYDYFWFIDYDVRILGDTSYFWRNELNHDLLIPKNITLVDTSWKFQNYIHESFQNNEKYFCFKQFYRISKIFLKKLDELFKEGINGHCELIIGSVCKKYNFSYDYNFLNLRIQGIWTQNPDFSGYNIEAYNKLALSLIIKPFIFHPIKIMKKEERELELEMRGKYERQININKIIQEDEKKPITIKNIDKNINVISQPIKSIQIKNEKKEENSVKKILIKKKI